MEDVVERGARLKRAEEIWFEARDLTGEARERFVRDACGGDDALRDEVGGLLAAADRAGGFLEQPALGLALSGLVEPEGTGATTEPEEADRLIGADLGPWRIEARIGTGGMGAVYRARRSDGAFEQSVAIKVVKRGMDTEEIVARFRQERRTLAALSHPNIARLLDGGVTADGRPYLVMELVSGEAIDEYAGRAGLSVRARLTLMLKVCEAVRTAHQSLVVHRDIKPGNILVDAHGEPKLMDFGIAKLLTPGDGTSAPQITLTAAAERRLTPEYASPEQIAGRPVTTATDVYSLGVVLYELLTGRRPYRFETRTTGEFERVVCTVEPLAPSTMAARAAPAGAPHAAGLRRELRGDLDAIVLTALAKDPARRYPSVEALSTDIRRYLDGLPVQARRAGVWYQARKFAARHRTGVAMAAALALVLIAGTGAVIVQNRRVAHERDGAYAARDQAEAVSEFMQGVFVAADLGAGGPNVTVRELLSDAADRVEVDLAERPLVRASVQSSIGRAYIGLGLLDEAERLIERSRQTRQGLLAPGHHDLAESQMDLAALRYARREFAEAETLLRGALETHRSLRGDENLDTARVWNDLGAVLRAAGKLDDAEQAHRQALSIREKLSGPTSLPVAESANNLSGVMLAKGDARAAVEQMERSIAIRRERLRPGHPMIVQGTYNLAVTLSRAGEVDRAIASFKQAAEQSEAALGASHPERARILRGLGGQLVEAGRFAEAEPSLRAALAIDDSAVNRAWLGLCLRGLGRTEEARRELEQALAGMSEQDARQRVMRSRVVEALKSLDAGETKSNPDHP